MRLGRRFSDFGRSSGRYYFWKIGVVLFHVPWRATSYVTNVQSEVKMAAYISRQSIFVFFMKKDYELSLLVRKTQFIFNLNIFWIIRQEYIVKMTIRHSPSLVRHLIVFLICATAIQDVFKTRTKSMKTIFISTLCSRFQIHQIFIRSCTSPDTFRMEPYEQFINFYHKQSQFFSM